MSDIVERLRKRQKMQDVRGTGDRFVKQVAVPDALCQLAADEIERLRQQLGQPLETERENARLHLELLAERERCAKIVESYRLPNWIESCDVRDELAKVIRSDPSA